MIEPTVGRVVWFHEALARNTLAAIISYVWNARLVNLAVFGVNGNCYGATSVKLLQPGDVAPQGSYCEWMPYQIGQAKRTEEAENKVQQS